MGNYDETLYLRLLTLFHFNFSWLCACSISYVYTILAIKMMVTTTITTTIPDADADDNNTHSPPSTRHFLYILLNILLLVTTIFGSICFSLSISTLSKTTTEKFNLSIHSIKHRMTAMFGGKSCNSLFYFISFHAYLLVCSAIKLKQIDYIC